MHLFNMFYLQIQFFTKLNYRVITMFIRRLMKRNERRQKDIVAIIYEYIRLFI